jgi:Na+-transporting methylmalonyl-CoA/oxaloacetate decarboxylase gamma subunit
VEVKRLIVLVILVMLVVILAGLSAAAESNTGTPLTNGNIPHGETATNLSEVSNSSASATIIITMYAVDEE